MADIDEVRERPARRRGQDKPTQPLAVIGIGVCAASLRSLEQLFASLDDQLDAAYVVAVGQQNGVSVDSIMKALSGQTDLPLKIAANGEKLEPGHIYVGGPEDLITFEDGHVRTRESEEPAGRRGTVDSMLISLAEHIQDRSVAVILSGLDGDGTAGVTATKKFGGLSIAEARGGDEDPSAQGAVTPLGIVDLLLPIEEIPKQIALYISNLHVVSDADGQEQAIEQASAEIAQIATILRNVTGNDFHGYKRNTFFRRVQRRMQVVQVDTIEDYVARLRGDRGEVQHLFQDLLIGVTQFFRDPSEFETLAGELPRLFDGKGQDDQLRVWVLGCATGEEAYSIAILLREHLATVDAPPFVQIFATDLDARALSIARSGRYAESIAEHVSPERLARWFVKEGETYCVSKELREMCIFSPHNLVKDAPFSRIDLLSCRNLLIYLNSDLQNRVIPIFHFALRPGGVLFLGSSENVTRHQKLFAPVDRKKRVFRRLETATRVLPDFPLTPRTPRHAEEPHAPATPVRAAGLAGVVSRRAEAVAERYAPAYAVVDDQYDVLHFSARTGRYLEPVAGAASLNLLNLVHRDLRLDLRAALHKAVSEGGRIETPHVPLSLDGQPHAVNLVVEPVAGETDVSALVVLFQDAGPLLESAMPNGDRMVSDEHVQRLESDLRLTKERLQATIEELESTNEELKSSNEEYQSINEELQSANEELETSKEELQSVNEELQTVNGELAYRVGELARTNSDLKNLLESTQIATVFLDNDLRVRSFTPTATDIFRLIETDVGRPIDHIAARIVYPDLQGDIRRVLKTLAVIEREVSGTDGDRNYVVRILPYRSIDNFIAGVVLTFLDVTTAVRAEAAMRESEARLQIAIEVGSLATWDWNLKSGQVTWNEMHFRMLGYEPGEIEPSYEAWAGRIHPDDLPAAEAALNAAREGRSDYEHQFRTLLPDGTIRWCAARGRYFYDAEGRDMRMIGVMEDMTERRRAEETQRVLVGELQHRTRNLLAIARSIAQQTIRSSPSLEEFGQVYSDRLSALSRVQGLLSKGDGFTVTLGELIRGEIEAHGGSLGNGKVTIDGPELALSSREVQVLTLVLHELATNAVKYGALGKPDGKLSISWSVARANGQAAANIEWVETGVDLDVHAANGKRGFGRDLIERAVPYDLGAKTSFAFRQDGLWCELRVPVRSGDEGHRGPAGETDGG
ncbi:putative two-component hybrid sensor and regulator [Sphingomonas changbaiensis NBRC 104936]|uniref:Putative two-component hybrid sensor and regulator n=1 Tax=Sphingomonas changbaiensis NBRC 104936 TaxID=1219043 RepID=A0A0E9MU70_9SPHN|nr:CheR family methyltransferase [Sphingomonas changbaiensis]GAO40956.1 putative two-component hybrid sensor and regulator [Sphingomonas changbaiensis NBRC 104936]